jgi:hypothetical protein
MIEVIELQRAQGDLVRAVQTIVRHNLPLTLKGAHECERLRREYREGNLSVWNHDKYLYTAISMAQECVREAREGYRKDEST